MLGQNEIEGGMDIASSTDRARVPVRDEGGMSKMSIEVDQMYSDPAQYSWWKEVE